jgi:hypothetical protein
MDRTKLKVHQYPTAQAFRGVSRKRLAKLSYDGRHQVGWTCPVLVELPRFGGQWWSGENEGGRQCREHIRHTPQSTGGA